MGINQSDIIKLCPQMFQGEKKKKKKEGKKETNPEGLRDSQSSLNGLLNFEVCYSKRRGCYTKISIVWELVTLLIISIMYPQ